MPWEALLRQLKGTDSPLTREYSWFREANETSRPGRSKVVGTRGGAG